MVKYSKYSMQKGLKLMSNLLEVPNLTLNLYRVIIQNNHLKIACVLYNASDSLPIDLDTLLSNVLSKKVSFQEEIKKDPVRSSLFETNIKTFFNINQVKLLESELDILKRIGWSFTSQKYFIGNYKRQAKKTNTLFDLMKFLSILQDLNFNHTKDATSLDNLLDVDLPFEVKFKAVKLNHEY